MSRNPKPQPRGAPSAPIKSSLMALRPMIPRAPAALQSVPPAVGMADGRAQGDCDRRSSSTRPLAHGRSCRCAFAILARSALLLARCCAPHMRRAVPPGAGQSASRRVQEMDTERDGCGAALMPDGRPMVMGGCGDGCYQKSAVALDLTGGRYAARGAQYLPTKQLESLALLVRRYTVHAGCRCQRWDKAARAEVLSPGVEQPWSSLGGLAMRVLSQSKS